MKSCFLSGLLVLAASAVASADDYILTIESVGCVDQQVGAKPAARGPRAVFQRLVGSAEPAGDKVPEETLLWSLEVLARPGERFHGRAVMGARTVTLRGELRPKDGDFAVRIDCEEAIDNGVRVLVREGVFGKVLDRTAFQTSVSVTPGTPCDLGEFTTLVEQETDQRRTTSKVRHWLRLEKADELRQSND